MLSIIIPVYNAEKYLRRCIESVIAQTYGDWEMILVNDGSKDGSLAICQEYAAKDKRISVLDKPNGGPSSARNVGLEQSRGEYVYFMDADDWVETKFLENFVSRVLEVSRVSRVSEVSIFSEFHRVEKPETRNLETRNKKPYDIVFQGFVREFADGRKEKSFAMDADTSVMPKEEIVCRLYKEHVYGWAWCKVFRREIIDKYHLCFDESLRLWEDELFTSEFLQHAESVRTVDSHQYHYISYDNSLMHTGNTYLKRLFLSERMNEALKPVANSELWEYVNKTYNENLKYSLLMALKNERNHQCDEQMKRTLLDRYYARCREYPELRAYNVLRSSVSYFIAETILQTRCKWLIINVLSWT